ncbi:MAG: copper resistance protein CopC [Gemmatimonadetes bacterium]|nr:copper resistance protein CopC [Gemmatimonadota bacterium]
MRTAAWAHATLLSAEPAAGSHLAAAPTRVRLVFSEALEATLASMSLVDGVGKSRPLAVQGDPRDVHAVVAPLDSLQPGAYHVKWSVVSADGHRVQGTLSFLVGDVAVSAPVTPVSVLEKAEHAAEEEPEQELPQFPIVAAILRGLAVGTLATLAGMLLFMVMEREKGEGAARARRAVLRLSVIAPVLLALHLWAWMAQASPDALDGERVSILLSSGVGHVELVRIALALLVLWALALARRPQLGLAFAGVALVVSGATGHAVAIHPAWAMPLKAIHLLAIATWVGGVAWLACQRTDSALFAVRASRVSGVALVSLVAVTVSGVVETLLFVSPVGNLLHTAYGAGVIAKVLGVAILALFGVYHRVRSMPHIGASGVHAARMGMMLRWELAVMSTIMLIGGVIAYLTPAPPGFR